MLTDSPDPVVAEACRQAGLVLVTQNYRDFKKIVKRQEAINSVPDKLMRIELSCGDLEVRDRFEAVLDAIEYEGTRRGNDVGGLRVLLGKTNISIFR